MSHKKDYPLNRQEVVSQLIGGKKAPYKKFSLAYAPANIALCKYWGKRDETLNLPHTSSLSISLAAKGTSTKLSLSDKDQLLINGEIIDPSHPYHTRVFEYLDLFREPDTSLQVDTRSTVAVAAGLASSASAAASLVLALDRMYDWGLTEKALSILARLNSGSGSRSIYHGFVEWHAGKEKDGMDSFAEPIPVEWPTFRLALVTVSDQPKQISSRDAMKRTVRESLLYTSWPDQVSHSMQKIRSAIRHKDIKDLGEASEQNAMAMHATMLACKPSIMYWQPETVKTLQLVWDLRQAGHMIYATMDAGPNIKLLFPDAEKRVVLENFQQAEIISPLLVTALTTE